MANKTLSRGFGPAGRALIHSIEAEMRENGVTPDSIESTALKQAARLADRQAELAQILKEDGLMVTSARGELKAHPALIESRQLAAVICRILNGVSLTDSSGGSRKSARHQRSARMRWAAKGDPDG